MYVCPVWTHISECRCPWRQEGTIKSPRAGVTGSCEQLHVGAGNQTPSLWKSSKRSWPQPRHHSSSYRCFWKLTNIIEFTNLILSHWDLKCLLTLQARNLCKFLTQIQTLLNIVILKMMSPWHTWKPNPFQQCKTGHRPRAYVGRVQIPFKCWNDEV